MQDRSPEHLFSEYLGVIHRLRKECPWDREQTHESLRSPLIEETYEVVDAIDDKKPEHLRNELGDLLLHIALQSEIASEEQSFTFADVLTQAIDKMIRRHPHVFSDTKVKDQHEVRRNWESIKRKEGKESILDGIPHHLPALTKAQRIQSKASAVGFDWNKKEDVWKKVAEELEELKEAETSRDQTRIEHEFGDLLFSLVNYCRFLKVDPEFALRKSIQRFGIRFKYIEDTLRSRGTSPEQSTLEEMDLLWDEAKTKVG